MYRYCRRRSYFKGKLAPMLLATRLTHISPTNRLPAVNAVLPLVPEQQRDVLRYCIEAQGAVPWNIESGKSAWHVFQSFPDGLVQGDTENLTSLEYWRFFEVASMPPGLQPEHFIGGVEDYLVNDFAVLESLRLAGEEEQNRAQRLSGPPDPGPFKRVLSYDDLRMHLHLCTAVVRLRAGWDKVANNVLRDWFDPAQKHNWPDAWPKRITALDTLIRAQKPIVLPLWEDFRKNAHDLSVPGGLRNIRDRDLHYWSPRTLETFGSPPCQ